MGQIPLESEIRPVFVALPIPKQGLLAYMPPRGMDQLEPGMRVLVPVGSRRRMIGVVWDPPAKSDPQELDIELKEVSSVLDEAPIISREYRRFLQAVSWYYFYPVGMTVEEALPNLLLSSRSSSIEKILKTRKKTRVRFQIPPSAPCRPETLTQEQISVLSVLKKRISRNLFSPVVLHGVTGSGKTEVYIRAAESALALGKTALILVPEIALASQLVAWFYNAFGDLVGLWHSKITGPQKLKTWQDIKDGKIRIIVGVRSAIFAPLENIGLIVVDEEHDDSFKQDVRLRYSARDLALLLGKLQNATVVLGSATPSLTTYEKVIKGEYELLTMTRRVHDTPLPKVELIDLRTKRKKKEIPRLPWWMSEVLYKAIDETLNSNEQFLLFLNRRGFATFVFCSDCGHAFRCPHCEITLTLHKSFGPKANKELLVCHSCGFNLPALPVCPNCGGQAISSKGIGTERVLAELLQVFPNIRAERFDRDTMGSKKKLINTLEDFRKGNIDALVGTQMITKGHDFPNLSLVGVIWGDQSLHYPSFNASEKTFQLLTQVAGRAGRRGKRGRVIIQSFCPEHYSIVYACEHDYESFLKEERNKRLGHFYPPFGHLINLIFSGKLEEHVKKVSFEAQQIAIRIGPKIQKRYAKAVEILGPSPGIRPKVKDLFVWNLLLKSQSRKAVRSLAEGMLNKLSTVPKRGVRIEIDCDPTGLG